MNVTYRVFREENGHYTFREVFTEHDSRVISYSRSPIAPIGESVDDLAREIAWLKEALEQPVLTVAEIEREIAKQSQPAKRPRKTISHADLMAKLELTGADEKNKAELPVLSYVN